MSKLLYPVLGGVTKKGKKLYTVLDGITRKAKKGYIAVDGVARLFYSDDNFAYTGNYTSTQIQMDYMLHTLTSSGTLTLGKYARYWMCGGGGNGGNGGVSMTSTSIYCGAGAGGNGAYTSDGNLGSGEWAVVIAAAKGASSITNGDTVYQTDTVSTLNGGTGGGEDGNIKTTISSGGASISSGFRPKGAGVSTIPFGVSSLKAHCAGGGGGTAIRPEGTTGDTYYYVKGGNGATNGSNCGVAQSLSTVTITSSTSNHIFYGGTGGEYGGGRGGGFTKAFISSMGQNATFYGSGGGGSGTWQKNIYDKVYTPSGYGKGYQGVCYILIRA